jgi:AAA family ATP:ADP antiporter
LYAWKDLYVVALVEIFYTYTNTVLSIKKASWIYGFFGAIGSIGGLIGNVAVGKIALKYGSERVLIIVVPLLVLMAVLGQITAFIHGPAKKPEPVSKEVKAAESRELPLVGAVKVVQKSSYLWLMFFLIIVVQVAMTLIDYEYNHVIEETFANVDKRTEIIGYIYAAVSVTTLIFNVLTGPIIGAVGVGGTMLIIPALLGAGMVGFLIYPVFAIIAAVKITGKVMDYSLFKAAKNLLYIPLSYEEKTAGKSIVDMLTFRLAKGGASLILMPIAAFGAIGLVSPLTLGLLAIWGVIVLGITKRFKKVNSENK